MEKILMNWSGGKDSAMALHLLQQNKNIEVISLLTSVNKEMQRISMHGVHIDLLKKQADCIGLPLQLLQVPESTEMEVYEKAMEEQLSHFSKLGVRTSAFGDILLEDLREYREKQLAKIGWKAKFPLWQKDTQKLVHDFIEMGFKTRVCCINKEFLGTEFLGRDIDEDFINDFIKQHIILRHHFVAFRKIGGGTQTTQKFIIEENFIRYIDNFEPNFTSPRLATLYSFLRDLNLISDDSLTELAQEKIQNL